MSRLPWSVWIGFDLREASAFAVARDSVSRFHRHHRVHGLVLHELQEMGLYTRPTEVRLGKLYDVISEHTMSTEFAISRFFVPLLEKRIAKGFDYPTGWALFMDCDVLVRSHLGELFNHLDDTKALYCVQHNHVPAHDTKMDGQDQSIYQRKNWSSIMAFNVTHPSNEKLHLHLLNNAPGRDLHRFCWLKDDEIGELSPIWNYLVGYTKIEEEPRIVHFTEGGPWLPAFQNVEYANEWRQALIRWADGYGPR